MNVAQAVEQFGLQIEHPDRVSWYQGLVQQWTGQEPQVSFQACGDVAAYVMGYHSHAGIVHVGPTQVWSESVEGALEGLSNVIYADLQQDITWIASLPRVP